MTEANFFHIFLEKKNNFTYYELFEKKKNTC